MGRAPSKDKRMKKTRTRATQARGKGRRGGSIFDEDDRQESQEEDLPKDEAGRRKIKRQYETLLGIRIEKLKGRILNRERINKTIEGVYFICAECKRVCHNRVPGCFPGRGHGCDGPAA